MSIGGGNIKIEMQKKVDIKATSRIESKNQAYAPRGGEKKVSANLSQNLTKKSQMSEDLESDRSELNEIFMKQLLVNSHM